MEANVQALAGIETDTVAWDRYMRPDAAGLHPAVAASLGDEGRFVTPRNARVILTRRYEVPVFFTMNNRSDRIHRTHLKGRFYESAQLEAIHAHFPPGGTFMDVGANIGNHTLYMLLLGGAARVIPIEPNPEALSLFLANVTLNGLLDRVELSTLGYGLDAAAADGLKVHAPKGNLGWAKIKPEAEAAPGGADVAVRAGDGLIGGAQVDFIKIDVEGMEIGALKGLEATIKRCRPRLFVEVASANRAKFFDLMDRWGYETMQADKEMKLNQNLLMGPKG